MCLCLFSVDALKIFSPLPPTIPPRIFSKCWKSFKFDKEYFCKPTKSLQGFCKYLRLDWQGLVSSCWRFRRTSHHSWGCFPSPSVLVLKQIFIIFSYSLLKVNLWFLYVPYRSSVFSLGKLICYNDLSSPGSAVWPLLSPGEDGSLWLGQVYSLLGLQLAGGLDPESGSEWS